LEKHARRTASKPSFKVRNAVRKKSCKKESQLCDVMSERQLEVDKQNWWQTPPTLKSGLKPKNKI
jgi:hypothetical protein